eukprot:COSAG01_NODE_4068_length_5383_cov_7.524981_6_plen_56_part_00
MACWMRTSASRSLEYERACVRGAGATTDFSCSVGMGSLLWLGVSAVWVISLWVCQ